MYTDVSIVFPALNEKVRLIPTLKEYHAVLGGDVEYIVVDNGSTDGTEEEVKRLFPFVRYIRSEMPLGKGGAVYAGFDQAKGSIVGFTDPDGATSAAEFAKLIAEIETYDMVIASRWLANSRMHPQQPLTRRLNSRIFNVFVRVLLKLPFSDTQCGAKILRKSAYTLVRDKLTLTNYSFDVDLLKRVLEHGLSVKEVPIAWRHVEGGSTFKPFRSGIKAVVDVAKTLFL